MNKHIKMEVNLMVDDDGFDVISSMNVDVISMKELVPLSAYYLHTSSLLIQLIHQACLHDEELAETMGMSLEIDLLTDNMKITQAAMARWLTTQGEVTCACDPDSSKLGPQGDPADMKEVHTISQLLERDEAPRDPFSISFRFYQDDEDDEE